MDVVVVGAPDDNADGVVGLLVLAGVDVFEVREGLQNGLPVAVAFGLQVGPGVQVMVVHGY